MAISKGRGFRKQWFQRKKFQNYYFLLQVGDIRTQDISKSNVYQFSRDSPLEEKAPDFLFSPSLVHFKNVWAVKGQSVG